MRTIRPSLTSARTNRSAARELLLTPVRGVVIGDAADVREDAVAVLDERPGRYLAPREQPDSHPLDRMLACGASRHASVRFRDSAPVDVGRNELGEIVEPPFRDRGKCGGDRPHRRTLPRPARASRVAADRSGVGLIIWRSSGGLLEPSEERVGLWLRVVLRPAGRRGVVLRVAEIRVRAVLKQQADHL
jgi:hypothetical protein